MDEYKWMNQQMNYKQLCIYWKESPINLNERRFCPNHIKTEF